jgi:hypothetical protein
VDHSNEQSCFVLHFRRDDISQTGCGSRCTFTFHKSSSHSFSNSLEASGNIGVPLVFALLKAHYTVTALTRADSNTSFPEGVQVISVDYTSVTELTQVLKGQQAVISVLGPYGLVFQQNIVEAAAAAGVTRFLPAEFGADLLNSRTAAFHAHIIKVDAQKLLVQKAKETGMSYTLIFTGPFLDWGLRNGFILDVKNHKGTLYDKGLNDFSATTIATIVTAILGCLEHLKETENRGVYIQDAVVSQQKLLEMARKLDPQQEWQLNYANTADMEKAANEAFERKDPDIMSQAGAVFRAHFGGEEFGMPFKKLDNELLGIKDMSDIELEQLVRDISRE